MLKSLTLVSLSSRQGVSRLVFLLGGFREESFSLLIQVVGRIQFLMGLRFPLFICSSPGYRLSTIPRFLAAHMPWLCPLSSFFKSIIGRSSHRALNLFCRSFLYDISFAFLSLLITFGSPGESPHFKLTLSPSTKVPFAMLPNIFTGCRD